MAEEKVTKTRRKRRTTKKRSVVDSADRNAACLSDGCNPEFVIGAEFDGVFEMPIIKKPKKIIIPDNLVPFSKMEKADPKSLRFASMRMMSSLRIFLFIRMSI